MKLEKLLKAGDIELVLNILGIKYTKTSSYNFTIHDWNSLHTLDSFILLVTKLPYFGCTYGSSIKRKSNPNLRFKTQGDIQVKEYKDTKYYKIQIKFNEHNDNLK